MFHSLKMRAGRIAQDTEVDVVTSDQSVYLVGRHIVVLFGTRNRASYIM